MISAATGAAVRNVERNGDSDGLFGGTEGSAMRPSGLVGQAGSQTCVVCAILVVCYEGFCLMVA